MTPKRGERLWRQEGLRVPAKQPQRGRLWLADGSLVRRRAERPTTSGPTSSSSTAPPLGARCGSSPSWMRTRARACVSTWPAGCVATLSWRGWPSSASSVGRRRACARTPARSSRPRRCATGGRGSACPPAASSPAVPGRTALWNHSPARCATSVATANASTPCWRPRSSSPAGGGRTTHSGPTVRSAPGHPPRKRRRSDPPPPPPLSLSLRAARRVPALTSPLVQRSGGAGQPRPGATGNAVHARTSASEKRSAGAASRPGRAAPAPPQRRAAGRFAPQRRPRAGFAYRRAIAPFAQLRGAVGLSIPRASRRGCHHCRAQH